MKRQFNPEPIKCYGWRGATAGELNPGREADAIGARFHGAWLTAYMIRRFGPPNCPSDDHKSLCSWTITTPMKELALLVTPYLADDGLRDGMCLHFGYRWSPALEKLADEPRRIRNVEFHHRVWKWAKGRFVGMPVTEGGVRRLVDTIACDDPQPDIGIYWADKHEDRKVHITRSEFFKHWAVRWIIADAYRDAHKKNEKRKTSVRVPEPMIIRRCQFALRASIRALMQPIMVRDVCFNATCGYLKDGPKKGSAVAAPFKQAGWACRVDC